MRNKMIDDFRCCEMKVQVKEVIEEKGFFWHRFDQTIFNVDQSHHQDDRGFINQLEVLEVKEKQGKVFHLLSERLAGEVLMIVDHSRRYINAQSQTMIYLIDVVMSGIYHVSMVDYAFNEYESVVEFEGKMISTQQKKELQISLNGLIRDDHKVNITYPKNSDCRQVSIGLFPPLNSEHIVVPSLKYIQMVQLLELVETEKGFRLVFICGDQLLYATQKMYETLKEASFVLNTSPFYINTEIHKLVNSCKKELK